MASEAARDPATFKAGLANLFGDDYFDVQFARALNYASTRGAATGECFAAANKMRGGDFEVWRRAWTELAERLEAAAAMAEKAGHALTASNRYARAFNYYRSSEFFVPIRSPDKKAIFLKAQNCFRKMASLGPEHVGEEVAIPYLKTTLPGYFFRPKDGGTRPTLIVHGGGDGSNEELYFFAGYEALRRGYNCLIFDGPGQRGALFADPDNVYRPDYEAPISAVIDFVLKQRGVHKNRIALYGMSLGGYTAARAAAFDHRIAALALNSPIVDFYKWLLGAFMQRQAGGADVASIDLPTLAKMIQALYDQNVVAVRFAVDQLAWIFGEPTIEGQWRRMRDFRLDGVESQIRCPTLCMFSSDEGAEALRQTGELMKGMRAPCRLERFGEEFGAEQHCQLSNVVYSNEVLFDWLDETLR